MKQIMLKIINEAICSLCFSIMLLFPFSPITIKVTEKYTSDIQNKYLLVIFIIIGNIVACLNVFGNKLWDNIVNKKDLLAKSLEVFICIMYAHVMTYPGNLLVKHSMINFKICYMRYLTAFSRFNAGFPAMFNINN